MHEEYSSALQGIFDRMDQPVLFVRDGVVLRQNRAASRLLCGMTPKLEECILPEGMELYRSFNGHGTISLNMRLGVSDCEATITREGGVDVFLLSTSPRLPAEYIHMLDRTARSMREILQEVYDAQNIRLSRDDADGARLERQNARINQGICRLERLAGSLSDYAGLSAGTVRGDFHRKELVSIFRRLAAHAEELSQAKIRFTCKEHVMMGQVDEPLLERAILNLIANALQHSGPGAVLELELKRLGPARAAISIRDEGSGMDSYTQSTARHTAGFPPSPLEQPRTGLGLALVDEIAKLHGGTLMLYSAEGEGTVAGFSISLRLPAPEGDAPIRCAPAGLDPYLVELSEVLPSGLYLDI